MNKLVTVTNADPGHQTLVCPVCGNDCLHLIQVEAFFRDKEDAETGVHAVVSIEGVDVDKAVKFNNPSSRRDGVRLMFTCETCHMDPEDVMEDELTAFELLLSQHKGPTFIVWST